MISILINHIKQLIKARMYFPKVGTKWVHSGYNDSGILRIAENKKSLKTNCFEAFLAGPTRLELATSCMTDRGISIKSRILKAFLALSVLPKGVLLCF